MEPTVISSGETFFTTDSVIEEQVFGGNTPGNITVAAQPSKAKLKAKKKLQQLIEKSKATGATKVLMLDPQESFPKLTKRFLEYDAQILELDKSIKELQTKKATVVNLRASVLAKAGELIGEGPSKKLIQSGDKLVMFQKPQPGASIYSYVFSVDDLIGIEIDKEALK